MHAEMQAGLTLFLALLVAHLAGDLVLRAARAGWEEAEPPSLAGSLRHAAVHTLLAYLTVGVFAPAALATVRLHGVIAILVPMHLASDALEPRLRTRTGLPAWGTFLADQALHVAVLGGAAALLLPGLRAWLASLYGAFAAHRVAILWLLVIYLATIFGGGLLIRLLLPGPGAGQAAESPEERAGREAERRLGLTIGWLERTLVLSAVLSSSPTTVGLIVAAKSIVRFKKLDDERFAEYFLLGTFLSLLLALGGGLLLRWLLWGTVSLE